MPHRTPLEKRLASTLRRLVAHHEDVMRNEGKVDVPCASTLNARSALREFDEVKVRRRTERQRAMEAQPP